MLVKTFIAGWWNMNKIVSYLGFAIKANKIVVGQSAIKRTLKQLHLIMVCSTASQNLKDLAKNVAAKQKCACIESQQQLDSLTHLENIKILALTDESLSKAIINEYSLK